MPSVPFDRDFGNTSRVVASFESITSAICQGAWYACGYGAWGFWAVV